MGSLPRPPPSSPLSPLGRAGSASSRPRPFLHPYPLLLPEIFRESLKGEGRSLRGLLARLACLPALKAGHPLARAEGQALLDALLACETPWVCPHGRPVLLHLKEEDLIRRFGRRSGARAKEESHPHPPRETTREGS
jgi:DNA mismatch repair protein MutL